MQKSFIDFDEMSSFDLKNVEKLSANLRPYKKHPVQNGMLDHKFEYPFTPFQIISIINFRMSSMTK
jgi:hypothetical protein